MPEKNQKIIAKDFVSTGKAAELCSVTPDTVLKWIKSGKIPANRTPGGHYRIHKETLIGIIESETLLTIPQEVKRPFQFCWEFYKINGGFSEKCMDCIVYRSRAKRCYEMMKLPDESGHAKVFCQGTCDECEYFRVVQGQRLNILVITNQKELTDYLNDKAKLAEFNLRISDNEYHCSMVIESFRPDYVVIDSDIGPDRCHRFAKYLSVDPRAPFLKIIIAGDTKNIPKDCDRMLFAVIANPFTIGELESLLTLARDKINSK